VYDELGPCNINAKSMVIKNAQAETSKPIEFTDGSVYEG